MLLNSGSQDFDLWLRLLDFRLISSLTWKKLLKHELSDMGTNPDGWIILDEWNGTSWLDRKERRNMGKPNEVVPIYLCYRALKEMSKQ